MRSSVKAYWPHQYAHITHRGAEYYPTPFGLTLDAVDKTTIRGADDDDLNSVHVDCLCHDRPPAYL